MDVENGYYNGKETVSFEAKAARNKLPRSLWETYSSFANSFGGTIVLGLEEDPTRRLKVVGVENPDKLISDLWSTLNDPCKVSINLLMERDVEVNDIDGKKLITIRVPRADRHARPVYINNSINSGTYRRNGEGDYHCTMSEITSMMRDNTDEPQDSKVLEDVSIDVLDVDTIKRFRTGMGVLNPNHVWVNVSDGEFLQFIGAARSVAGVLHPTIAGLLMFGKEYSIATEMPDYKVDYLEYDLGGVEWTYRLVSGTADWSGNLYDFYTSVANRVVRDIERPLVVGNDMRRVDDTDVRRALREGVVNALVHSDYRGRLGIRIEKRQDVVKITNPGIFRVPLEKAEAGGLSDPRNPILAKMFSMIGYAERAGTGLYLIMRSWKNGGFPAPVFSEGLEPPTVTLELSFERVLRRSVDGTDIQGAIAKLMCDDGKISIVSLSKKLGISKSIVERTVNEMKSSGKVKRVGGKRGEWIVTR